MSGEEKKENPVPLELLEYSKAQFDRHAADFDVLDSKALGIMGIIGLLIGFQALNVDNTASIFKDFCIGKCPFWLCSSLFLLLLIHGGSLIIGITKALFAYQIKDIDYPTSIKELIGEYRNNKDSNKALEALKMDIVNTYGCAVSSLEGNNSIKSEHLKWSVKAIFISVVSLIAFLVLMLIYKGIY